MTSPQNGLYTILSLPVNLVQNVHTFRGQQYLDFGHWTLILQ